MKTDDSQTPIDLEKSLDTKHCSDAATSVSALEAVNSGLRTGITLFLNAYNAVFGGIWRLVRVLFRTLFNGIWRLIRTLFNRRFWLFVGRLVFLLVLMTPLVVAILLLSGAVGYVVEACAGRTAGLVVGWFFGLSSVFFAIRTLCIWARKKRNRSLSPSGSIPGSTNDSNTDTNHDKA